MGKLDKGKKYGRAPSHNTACPRTRRQSGYLGKNAGLIEEIEGLEEIVNRRVTVTSSIVVAMKENVLARMIGPVARMQDAHSGLTMTVSEPVAVLTGQGVASNAPYEV